MNPADDAAHPHLVREVEQKFRVHGLFRIPDLTTVEGVTSVEELGTVELEAAYYDTPDLRLAREGITLRRRVVRGDAIRSPGSAEADDDDDDDGDDDGNDEGHQGWHLKLPTTSGGPGSRDEFRAPLEAAGAQPPGSLTDIVRVIVRDSPVDVVSTLRTNRERRVVRAGATSVAELVDDTVHVVEPDGSIAARFRELELEQIDGGPLVGAVADSLTAAGAVGGEFVAKVVRALGPSAVAPPEVPEPGVARPKDPARDTLVAYLARHVRAFRAADIAYRCEPSDSEAVHQLRVASRRLRSGLRTFRPLVDHDWSTDLRTELAWFGRSLGDLRESDVLRERLLRHCAELPADLPADDVRTLLADALGARVSTARERVTALMNSTRYLDLHARLVDAVHHTPVTAGAEQPARDVLPGLVAKADKRLQRACAALPDTARGAVDGATDEQWHAVRLAAKRTRYAAEAVAFTLGGDAKTFAKRITKLTDILGEHQDAAQAAATARELANSEMADPDVAFALGVLASNERDHVHGARRRFAAAWSQARRAKWRRWLSS